MELDWIEDFLVLADVGIFSKAALRRNVTQPAFTRRIRKLEFAMGATLFDRSVHPVVLTPAGEAFRPTASEMLRLVASSKSQLGRTASQAETVTITSLQSLASSYLAPMIGNLSRARNLPAIRVIPDNFAGCVEALSTGGAEFMLCYNHSGIIAAELGGGVTVLTVAHDRMIAVSAPNATGGPVYQLDGDKLPYLCYSDESFLGKMTSNILAKQPELLSRLERRFENSMADGLKSAARVGLGVAWVPLRMVEDDLDQGRLLRISGPAEEAAMDIALFRDAAPKSRPAERLWEAIERHPSASAE